MTGISFAGFAGVANAATNGTLVLTADNPNTAPANSPYATILNDPLNPTQDTINVDATYTVGSDIASSSKGGAFAQEVVFTVTGSAFFVATGTQTDSCTIAAGGGSCDFPVQVVDPISEKPVVTATLSPTVAFPNNDPTVVAQQRDLHFASLTFNDCPKTGAQTNNAAPTAPDVYCFNQQTAGAAVTQTVTYLQDGQPKANVSVEITDSTSTFAASQPAGTAFFSPHQVNCNTNAAGQCSFTYTDATVGNTETIVARTVANTNPYPNSSAYEKVTYITSATPARIEQISSVTLKPNGTGGSRKPGVAQEVRYRLFANDCTTAPANFTCEGTPLANRSVTLSVDHGFFTRNCSVNGLGGSGAYAQCTFNPTPTAGSPVGNLASLGTSIVVTTDADGYFYATLAIARDTGFDDDGEVLATVTGVVSGVTMKATQPGVGTAGQTCTLSATPNNGCTKAVRWTTDVPPLNGGTITFLGVNGDVVSGDPNNVPLDPGANSGRDYVVHLTDQFGNLTSDRFGNGVDITFTGVGTVSDNFVLGSYTNADTFEVITSDSNVPGLQTVKGTWAAEITKFTTYTPRSGNTPAVAIIETSTVDKTATVKFNFYDQLAQPVVTFSTSPSNTVTKGTAVTVSATVKDQFGAPIPGQRVTFLVTGPNQSSCTPQNNTALAPGFTPTNANGQAGFVFSCNNAGLATVSIVVTDPSNNELARGVQNVNFTQGAAPPPTGDPSFSLNVGTIQIGQCAVLTVNGTPGHTITIFVKGAGAAGFTALNSMQPTQHMRVCPGTHSEYKVSSDLGASGVKKLLVKAIETLVVTRRGQSATFAGHVIPGVVGRRVEVFFYVDGGHVESGGVGTVKPGGNFSFTHTVNHPGRVVHAFAQTFADFYNTSGRSRLIDTQF